eukprot:m.32667 g.32667  ORF g.32667 m.32667 type:complete len:81 (+) comp5560_c0_seq1:1047-1289(+)
MCAADEIWEAPRLQHNCLVVPAAHRHALRSSRIQYNPRGAFTCSARLLQHKQPTRCLRFCHCPADAVPAAPAESSAGPCG